MSIRAHVTLAVVVISVMAGTPALPLPVPRPASLSTLLWVAPTDLATRDLFAGPWGPELVPDPRATYTFVKPKSGGANPGVVVADPRGRIWHVKQPRDGSVGDEGPVEVALSRVLSAVGYHQPPVYFVRSFTMADGSGVHTVAGGRFRLHDDKLLKDIGEWSWHDNPFVGTQPFNGLLAILLAFNSTDLKNSNNSLYEARVGDHTEQWYAVRDMGSALGESGSLKPKRNNLRLFERQHFITGVDDGFVQFDYDGKKPELYRKRITVADMTWAMNLLGGLSDRQWHDAFRAGGYSDAVATGFIRKIAANIRQGQQLGNRSSH
jgi:hypothetical protein